jgi:hypothetical protein
MTNQQTHTLTSLFEGGFTFRDAAVIAEVSHGDMPAARRLWADLERAYDEDIAEYSDDLPACHAEYGASEIYL